MAATARILLWFAVGGGMLAACSKDAGPRDAFVGKFGFASDSFESDCSLIPEDHQTFDDEVEITLDAGGELEIALDRLTVPCEDETNLTSEPKRIGCERTRQGVTYVIELRIDNSYDYPNRMQVTKLFTEPAACTMTFSGNLTPL